MSNSQFTIDLQRVLALSILETHIDHWIDKLGAPPPPSPPPPQSPPPTPTPRLRVYRSKGAQFTQTVPIFQRFSTFGINPKNFEYKQMAAAAEHLDGEFQVKFFPSIIHAFGEIRKSFHSNSHLVDMLNRNNSARTHLVRVSFLSYLVFGPADDPARGWLYQWYKKHQPPTSLLTEFSRVCQDAIHQCYVVDNGHKTWHKKLVNLCRYLHFENLPLHGMPQYSSMHSGTPQKLMKTTIKYWHDMSHCIITLLNDSNHALTPPDITAWFNAQGKVPASGDVIATLPVSLTCRRASPHSNSSRDHMFGASILTGASLYRVAYGGSSSSISAFSSLTTTATTNESTPPPPPQSFESATAAAALSEQSSPADEIIKDESSSPAVIGQKATAVVPVATTPIPSASGGEVPIRGWPNRNFQSYLLFIPDYCHTTKYKYGIYRFPTAAATDSSDDVGGGGGDDTRRLVGKLYMLKNKAPLDCFKFNGFMELFKCLGLGYTNVNRASILYTLTNMYDYRGGAVQSDFISPTTNLPIRVRYQVPENYPFLTETPKFPLRVDQLQTLAFLTECEMHPIGSFDVNVRLTDTQQMRILLYHVNRKTDITAITHPDIVRVEDLMHGCIDSSSMGVGKSVTIVALCNTMYHQDQLLAKNRWWNIARFPNQAALCSAIDSQDLQVPNYNYRYALPATAAADTGAVADLAQQQQPPPPHHLHEPTIPSQHAFTSLVGGGVGTDKYKFNTSSSSSSSSKRQKLVEAVYASSVNPTNSNWTVSDSWIPSPSVAAAIINLDPPPTPAAAATTKSSRSGSAAASILFNASLRYPMLDRYPTLDKNDPDVKKFIPTSQDRMLKTLLLCPPTIVGQWRDFFLDNSTNGNLKVKSLHTADEFQKLMSTSRRKPDEWPDVLIMSWVALRAQSVTRVMQRIFSCRIIIDEYHKISTATKTYTFIHETLRSRSRIVLTGTPDYRTVLGWIFPGVRDHTHSLVHVRGLRHDKAKFNDQPLLNVRPPKFCIHQCPMHDEMKALMIKIYEAANAGRFMRQQHGDSFRNLVTASIALSRQTLEGILNTVTTLQDRSDSVRAATIEPANMTIATQLSLQERDDDCMICFDEFVDPIQTNCRHVMCKACIMHWLNRLNNRTCPVCRQSVSKLFLPLFQPTEAEESKEEESGESLAATATVAAEATASPSPSAVSDAERAKFAPKLPAFLREMKAALESTAIDGGKILLFAARKQSLTFYENELKRLGVAYLSIGPGQSNPEKEAKIARFRTDPSVRVLICLQRTASAGVDLSIANHVFIMDLTHKMSAFLQMVGRIDREGQIRQPHIHLFLVPGTAEEYIFHRARQSMEITYKCLTEMLRFFNQTYLTSTSNGVKYNIEHWTHDSSSNFKIISRPPAAASADAADGVVYQVARKCNGVDELFASVDKFGWCREYGESTISDLYKNVHML